MRKCAWPLISLGSTTRILSRRAFRARGSGGLISSRVPTATMSRHRPRPHHPRAIAVHGDHVVAGDHQVDGNRVAVAGLRGAAGRERRENEKCRHAFTRPLPGRTGTAGSVEPRPERHADDARLVVEARQVVEVDGALTFSSSVMLRRTPPPRTARRSSSSRCAGRPRRYPALEFLRRRR